MTGERTLSGLARPEALEDLHHFVVGLRREHPSVGSQTLTRVETALTELLGNVVEHGQPPLEVRYALAVTVTDSAVEAVLTDDSRMAAPSAAGEMPEVWAESGRGLPLAEALADELVHEPTADGNCWRMVVGRAGTAG
ncbi:ATP-binding protein [Ornithinicoccus halotolerans]|uniref:ATP-binding protein n=1 Tax=Ornithinicoccus halotolerans TaxID=1748220 RepID=UPI0012978CDD|nr:ATP-binding protein [Ornithinicoccus halotolerans]